MKSNEPGVAVPLLILVALLVLAAVLDASAQGPVYLPAVSSDATPTALPVRTLHPPAGYVCFANWSGNSIVDSSGVTYWTCTTEEDGTCLFRVVADQSQMVRCIGAPSGGGEAILDIAQDGYGYWQMMTVPENHAQRGLLVLPIPGWVR